MWHRDVKPANLIVMRNGRVKIADFGIARVEASELTQTGAVMGSPGYMAPEQYAAAGIDQRADIFAAGVVCYQLLTNVKPFAGTAEQIAYAVCHTEVPKLSTVDPGHRWERYDAIVAKALAKKPEDRYQSAGAFLAALLEAHAAPASPAVSEETVITEILKPAAAVDPSGPPRPRTVPPASAAPSSPPRGPAWRGRWAIAAGAVALVAAGLWQLLSQRPAPPPPVAERTPAAPKEPSPPARAQPDEMVFWESVRSSSSPAEFEAYLAKYPEGTFAPLARARLDALAAAEAKRAADAKSKATAAAAAPKAAPAVNVARFDGSWNARFTCEAYQELKAGGWDGKAEIRAGEARVSWGTQGQPRSGQFEGRVADDDRLALGGTGITSLKSAYGKSYPIRFDGRFDAQVYRGSGKLGARNCTLALTRASG